MKRLLLGFLCVVSAAGALAQTCSPTTFLTSTSYLLGGSPWAVAVGDFTNDTILDVANANNNDFITVLPGAGDGTFGAPINTSEDIYNPYYAVAGHFHASSNLDLAIDSTTASTPSPAMATGRSRRRSSPSWASSRPVS